MQKTFGQFDPALHATGESFHKSGGPVCQIDAAENVPDAFLQSFSGEPIETALMFEIFIDRELGIKAGSLKDNTDLSADGLNCFADVRVKDGHASSRGRKIG